MPTPRQILDLLSRDERVEIVDRRDIIVADRRAKGHLVGRIEEKAVPLADVLAGSRGARWSIRRWSGDDGTGADPVSHLLDTTFCRRP